MQISQLYWQRALECERMAALNPLENQKLKEIAEMWRLFADEADAQSDIASTLH